MFSKTLLNHFILILLITVKLTCGGVLNNPGTKKDEIQGLYSTSDDVQILTVDNFDSQVYNSDRIWFIEFYNSWCGFCQRFAPSWKALATDMKGWKNLIGIAALDCSNERNYPLCRDFEIMAYPTLKYFHENYIKDPKNLGEKIETGSDLNEHREKLLSKVMSEQKVGRAINIPNLLPFESNNLNALFNNNNAKYGAIIVQPPGSTIGAEVTLALNSVKDLSVRYALKNDTVLSQYSFVHIPGVFAVNRDLTGGTVVPMLGTSRNDIIRSIRSHFFSKLDIPIEENTKNIFSGKWLETKVPENPTDSREYERRTLRNRIKQMGDVVFQMDLETALRYSLKHEVAAMKLIQSPELGALQKFVSVLVKYFPFGKYGQAFLRELKVQLSQSADIEGRTIANFVSEAEQENRQVFSSSNPQWLACQGSASKYRGYPCGLWTLFHYLTINAADQNKDQPDSYPREILDAMHGYIKNFFGCSDCSRHFQQMAERRKINDVTTWDESILWLWKAHNEVNKRLAGDQTEDPEFPKYQFPAKERCPQCYNRDDTWNEIEVLKYLKHMYGSINVRYIGSDTRILHLGLEGSSGSSGSSSLFETIDTTRVPEKDVRT